MSSSSPDISGRIARLFVYPVKSCAGVELSESLLTEAGLDLDRTWMVVDDQGEFVTQRELPRMALVRPQLKRYEVVLRAPGMLALHLAADAAEQPVQVRLWDESVPAYDMGNVAAQWFTDFLGQGALEDRAAIRKLRLVRFDPEHRRLSSREWTDGVEVPNQFNDGFPLLVLGEGSLQDFNARMAAAGHPPVGIERFRPNIVVSGLQSQDEDRVDLLRIATDGDEVQLRPVKPCPRCPIPNVDPATARIDPQVGDVLRAYRNDRLGGAVTFGMNAIVVQGAEQTLRVGQPVSANWRFD